MPALQRSLLIGAVLLNACGGDSSSAKHGDDTNFDTLPSDAKLPGADVGDTGPSDEVQTECALDSDCYKPGGCVSSWTCDEGSCQVELLPVGSACAVACDDGSCGAEGACTELKPRECAEKDGNTCTVPSCIVTATTGAQDSVGECTEVVIEDGLPPYASSECFEGAVCLAGQVDSSESSPTPVALECQELGLELDPLGCVDQYVCVGGAEKCKPVVKPSGTQCWESAPGGESATCAGQSCSEGECLLDPTLDEVCGPEDLPVDCVGGCQTCTQLVCHWIEDPATPGGGTPQIRYCQPQATVGEACGDNLCKVDQQCGFGSQADGPLGKEFLGACVGGEDKSPAQCLAEAGKPALTCLLAGASCDPAEGGCVFDQKIMDQWCWPPEGLCWKKDETYCTHLDSGAAWDAETGCNIAWVDLNCDDANECTIGQCKPQLSDFVCDYTLLSGSPCSDGDPCTVDEACAAGECTGQKPKCDDGDPCNGAESCATDGTCDTGAEPDCDDGNECTLDSCQSDTGCAHAPNEGVPCDDGLVCTLGSLCVGKVCQAGTVPKCDDGDLCDGLESCDSDGTCHEGTALDCDDKNPCTIDGCDTAAGCTHSPNGGAACEDGNLCTLGSVCAGTICQAGPVQKCDDGNVCDGLESCDLAGNCHEGTPPSCEDGNPCTTGSCDAVTGCSQADNSQACDDEDPCSASSQCQSGVCTGTSSTKCDDGDPCTKDLCEPADGCTTVDLPDSTLCPGGICVAGKCTCVPDCDGTTCGSDGCGGSCECATGKSCVAGVCEASDNELDGLYYVTGNPDSQLGCGGLCEVSFVPFHVDLSFTETTVSGVADTLVGVINYTGTRDGDDFTLSAKWVYATAFGNETHQEEWECSFVVPGKTFTGTMVDSFVTILGADVLTWTVQGAK